LHGFLLRWLIFHLSGWSVVALLLAPLLPGGLLATAVLPVVTALPVVVLLRAFRAHGERRSYAGRAMRLLVMRPFWYGQLAGPLLGGAGLLGVVIGLPFGAPGAFGRAALAGAALALLLLATAGWLGSRRLRVKRLTATWPDLPPALEGLRIAQLSDLHVGPHLPHGYLARVRRAVDDAAADMVLVTGDLVDDFARDADVYARWFGSMSARLGVWISPGNHDVYAGWDDVRARLEQLPVRVLVNEWRAVRHGDTELAVVGLGDPAGRHWHRDGGADVAPAPERAVAGIADGVFTIALAHNPVLWPELARLGVRLTLSGHTHWGQFAHPGRAWSLASHFLEHAMGTHSTGQSLLYIHPGTGYWGIPFRLGAWPEVAIIELRRGGDVARW
jgi:hypothetical protein